ncbi:MAG: hypothetical protein OCC49_16175 [Fibrobacterales bacterium]
MMFLCLENSLLVYQSTMFAGQKIAYNHRYPIGSSEISSKAIYNLTRPLTGVLFPIGFVYVYNSIVLAVGT